MALIEEIQYDLFEDYDELDVLRKQMGGISQSQDKLRKGLFARLNKQGFELAKVLDKLHELEMRLGMIERNIKD